MKDRIKEIFKKYGFELNDEQAEKFNIYLDFLLEENQKYNLTAITDSEEVIIKHFVDSVLGENLIDKGVSLIDVGSGAGFPSVPIKIIRPDIKLTLIDSLGKRVHFLEELSKRLNLKDVVCKHIRAEDFAKKEGREHFDFATARAVASIATLSEYLLPFVKPNGKVIMYKGQKCEEELAEGKCAIKVLGGELEKIVPFELDALGVRKIVVIKKISKTPLKYPRGQNQPKTKPILACQ